MKSKSKGFTLIEFILVIVISSMVAIIVNKIISAQLRSVYTSTSIVNANAQIRLAMVRMASEIRNSVAASGLSSTSNANQLVFTNSDGVSITYSLSGTSLMRNANILADDIQSITFTYYNKNGVVIAPPPTTATVYIKITIVAAVQTTNVSLTTTVFMRNA